MDIWTKRRAFALQHPDPHPMSTSSLGSQESGAPFGGFLSLHPKTVV